MNRDIGFERVFKLGDFKTLRIADTITNLPEELALNTEFVDALRLLQMASVDLLYQEYYQMTLRLSEIADGKSEKITALLSERANALETIEAILTTNKE